MDLLAKANIPSLHIRRLKTITIETFKSLNNMPPTDLSDLINLRENSTHNFRYNNILLVPQVRTSKFDKKSLGMLQQFYGTASLMNLERLIILGNLKH